jgi:hypothetical protein
MTASPQSIEWAKTFRSLLADYTAALGGERISPVRRATARQLATLSTELSVLGDRFCASGSGASTDDLNRFLRISETVGSLLRPSRHHRDHRLCVSYPASHRVMLVRHLRSLTQLARIPRPLAT